MKSITRKTLLYKTGVEYGDYTINHVQGCFHGCKYPCYAYLMAKRFGRVKTYQEWIEPKIVSNALELLEKEIPKFKKDIKSVYLCFTTDPFMIDFDEVSSLSLKIINLLNKNDIKCVLLTKGLYPSKLLSFSKDNEYGISLVSLDETFRKLYEPNTSTYIERIASLKKLSDNGFKTWISIEPYPTPNIIEQNFDELLNSISFANKIIFGRMNYNKKVSEFKDYKNFYNELASKTIEFCKKNNKEYHIKDKTITIE